MALSMDEQRILDEMERNLAADDPRLAARLDAFGQPRVHGHVRFQRARTVGGVLALALIAAVTVMVFVISPFAHHMRNERPPVSPSSAATTHSPQASAAKNAAKVDRTADAKAAGGSKTSKDAAHH